MALISYGESIGKAEYGFPAASYPPITTRAGRWLRRLLPPSWIKPQQFDTDVPWYLAEPGEKLTETAQSIFKQHTGITDNDELIRHLCDIRNRAWNHPGSQYPYLGRWWFLRSILAKLPQYDSILSQAKEGSSILDIGCGLGHELRYLRLAGAMGNMYAIDVQQDMWDLGLELFKDKKKSPATFIEAEMITDYNPNSLVNRPPPEKVDIVLLCRFLDLHWLEFGRFAIINIMKHCSKVGTRVIGYTLGTTPEKCGIVQNRGENGGRMLYSELSLWQTFDSAAEMSDTKWDMETRENSPGKDIKVLELDELGFDGADFAWMEDPPTNALCFCFTRVE